MQYVLLYITVYLLLPLLCFRYAPYAHLLYVPTTTVTTSRQKIIQYPCIFSGPRYQCQIKTPQQYLTIPPKFVESTLRCKCANTIRNKTEEITCLVKKKTAPNGGGSSEEKKTTPTRLGFPCPYAKCPTSMIIELGILCPASNSS